jgi:hypothetical protein
MDSSHKLEAPNEEELRTIEHIEDRSGLSTLYRAPGQQFEGEILSSEARDKAKAEKLEAITSGIGKSALKIGLYIPYPFVSGSLLAVFIYTSVNWANAFILFALVILSIGAWMITSYLAYAAIFKTFYKHALRAGPFLLVMLVSMLMAAQAIYGYVADAISNQSLLFNVAIVSLLVVLFSVVASYILLGIWGNSRLGSGVKAAVSGALILVSGFLVASVYLF